LLLETLTVFSVCIGIVVCVSEKSQTHSCSCDWAIDSIFDHEVCKNALINISNAQIQKFRVYSVMMALLTY